MGLVGNRFINSTGVQQPWGDAPAIMRQNGYGAWSRTRSQDVSATVVKGLSFPSGLNNGYGWFQPSVGGDLSLRSDSTSTLSGDLIPTRAMSLDLTGAGDLAATAALAVAMAAAMTGSGSISAIINGRLNAVAGLTGSGSITAALSGIGNMILGATGSGTVAATIAAYGDMEIDIIVTGAGLTNESIAAAVWDRLAVLHTDPGSMGKKLSDAEKAAKLAAALSA
jgi:hypothetical protein